MFNVLYKADPFAANVLEGVYASLLTSAPLVLDATTEAFVQVPWASVVAIVTPIVVGGVWVVKRTIERSEKDRELLSAQLAKEHDSLTNLLKTLQTYVENANEHRERVAEVLASVSNKQDEQLKRLDAHVVALTANQTAVLTRLTAIDNDLQQLNKIEEEGQKRRSVRRKKATARK